MQVLNKIPKKPRSYKTCTYRPLNPIKVQNSVFLEPWTAEITSFHKYNIETQQQGQQGTITAKTPK